MKSHIATRPTTQTKLNNQSIRYHLKLRNSLSLCLFRFKLHRSKQNYILVNVSLVHSCHGVLKHLKMNLLSKCFIKFNQLGLLIYSVITYLASWLSFHPYKKSISFIYIVLMFTLIFLHTIFLFPDERQSRNVGKIKLFHIYVNHRQHSQTTSLQIKTVINNLHITIITKLIPKSIELIRGPLIRN